MNKSSSDLERLRQQIDALDEQLVDLIIRRIQTARDIGRQKRETGQDITDQQREDRILHRLKEQVGDRLSMDQLKQMYSVIFQLCRDVQEGST